MKKLFCILLMFCLILSAVPGCKQSPTPIKSSEPQFKTIDTSGKRTTNFFGIHTMIYPMDDMDLHMDFAEHLVGKGGYVKERFEPITPRTKGPASEWIDFLNECYSRDLIPIVRVGGEPGPQGGARPEADADGSYKGLAQAVKRVFEQIPLKAGVPVYVEIFNEDNIKFEWGETPDPVSYGKCLVEISKALRSIGDPRIRVMNGALCPGGDYPHLNYLEKMLTEVPESLWAFDVWASHPYMFNQPPEYNHHDGTVSKLPPLYKMHTIDAYVQELEIIKKHGRDNVKVILTETGFELNSQLLKNYPVLDEEKQSDYMLRAFRDYWVKWPEIIAVAPFEMWAFQNKSWERYDWIALDAKRGEDGAPTKARKMYYTVSDLVKPPYVKEEALKNTKDVAGILPVKGNVLYKAKLKTSSSIENYGWSAEKLVNGFKTDSDLGWSSNGTNVEEWVEFELAKSQDISKIKMYARTDGKTPGKFFPQSFVIQAFINGNYKNVYTYAYKGKDLYIPKGFVHTASFKKVTTDKIRIVITKKANSDNYEAYHAQISEIEAFK